MPRKTAAQKAAEEAAAAEAARRETEQQRLKWVGVAIIALALFAAGYAVGQSNAEEQPSAFSPLIVDGEVPPFLEDFDGGPFAEGFDFDGDVPPFFEDFDPGFRFDFDPGRFDGPGVRDRIQQSELSCDIVERDGRTITLVCEGPGLLDITPDGQRPRDERRDDGRPAEEAGFLGVGIVETDFGVTVTELLDDGPAAQAGIEIDDVIVAFGDIEVRSADHLADLIAGAGAGSDVDITVRRFESEVTVRVVLGERPE